MCFVQRERSVALHVPERPRVKCHAPFAVQHRDLFQCGHVRKNPFSVMLDRKALGFGRQRDFSQEFSFRNGDDGDAGLAPSHATHVKLFGARIILQFIQVGLEINPGHQVKGLALVNVDTLAARDIELIELGGVSSGGGPFPVQAAPRLAGIEVYNFECLVGGRRCEEPLMFRIHRHVVESALNIGKSNRLRQHQRIRFLRLSRRYKAECHGEEQNCTGCHWNLMNFVDSLLC